MKFEDVAINDSEELAKLAKILKENNGKVALVKGYRYFGTDIEDRDYFESYGVIQDVTYSQEDGLSRLDFIIFHNDVPVSMNFDFKLIQELENYPNGEILYSRKINGLVK